MKKFMEKFLIIIIFFILALTLMHSLIITPIYADNFDFNGFDDDSKISNVQSKVSKAAGTAIMVARIICFTIAIVILLVIAMKYMISSAGDRADIKKHAVNYVIGAVILFGVTGILSLLNSFAEKF